MTILPSAYLPPISYFVALVAHPTDVMIDIGEHYIKRSLRNRARIMTAQGVMELSIPIKKANRPCTPICGVEIDNSKKWQHQHWMAILSAYKSSPYFDHYAPYIEPLYRREWSSLVDLNREFLLLIIKLLQLDAKVALIVSNCYIEASEADLDLRPKGRVEALPSVAEYMQVFFDRHPHTPNLSILDLLFCEGPNATALLMVSC